MNQESDTDDDVKDYFFELPNGALLVLIVFHRSDRYVEAVLDKDKEMTYLVMSKGVRDRLAITSEVTMFTSKGVESYIGVPRKEWSDLFIKKMIDLFSPIVSVDTLNESLGMITSNIGSGSQPGAK